MYLYGNSTAADVVAAVAAAAAAAATAAGAAAAASVMAVIVIHWFRGNSTLTLALLALFWQNILSNICSKGHNWHKYLFQDKPKAAHDGVGFVVGENILPIMILSANVG